ncbi:helix-turn-helix transcriptional regulator [Flavobacterium sp.]|uniref:helix-turn-helix domain-containing protein n=1 Tax=Flavobacterium sp. TaxID=239 RepID=UPI003266EA24
MNFKTLIPDQSISHFVKSILVFDETKIDQETILPFFADGYPGLMFQDSENGLFLSPHNKHLPLLFLYGQTITPIEIVINGTYQLIIFQLYPFVLKSFFNVTAKEINDSCYDLNQIENGNMIINQLNESSNLGKRIAILTSMLFDIFQSRKETLDLLIRQAIQIVMDNKGQISIVSICDKINLTERTFERRFMKEVGISAKQFSNIIKFQFSMQQLTTKDFEKLTDIVYENGYSDQSHFIKVFKVYTGKTPKSFK